MDSSSSLFKAPYELESLLNAAQGRLWIVPVAASCHPGVAYQRTRKIGSWLPQGVAREDRARFAAAPEDVPLTNAGLGLSKNRVLLSLLWAATRDIKQPHG